MDRSELLENYKTIIDTQFTINSDKSAALQKAWDMCMLLGRRHRFWEHITLECWCQAIQDRERDAKS